MNARQKAFADYFIETGNASEAARRAGYSEKVANRTGSKLLSNADICRYIRDRMASKDAERIASQDEVLEWYTNVMRGKEKDQFGLDPSLADRLKAADALMKRYDAGRGRGTQELDESLAKALTEAAEDVGESDGDVPI